MIRKLLPLLLLGVFISACGSGSNETNPIDYATLDTLETEVVLEIGDTEDYIPGRFTSLVVTDSDNILVSDRESKTIEQFGPDGRHRATIAREGNGPGEIGTMFFYLYDVAGDTVMVNQGFSQRDFFSPDSAGIYQFNFTHKGRDASERRFSLHASQSDTTYYAGVVSTYSSGNKKEGENIDFKQSALVVINSKGDLLQDSVQMYKEANPHIYRRSQSSISVEDIPYRFDDDLAFLSNGNYLIARADSNAIYQYNNNHDLVKKIPLHVARRPVTSNDIEYHLRDIENPIRNEIEERVGDYKPPYLNVYATKDYIWLYADTREAGKKWS